MAPVAPFDHKKLIAPLPPVADAAALPLEEPQVASTFVAETVNEDPDAIVADAVAEHPPASVAVTVNIPDARLLIVAPVAPLDHT